MNKVVEIGGKKFTLKEELRARERRAVNEAMLDGIGFGIDGKPTSDIKVETMSKREDAIIKACVVDVDGIVDPEKILEAALDLSIEDYDGLFVHLAPIVQKLDQAKKV